MTASQEKLADNPQKIYMNSPPQAELVGYQGVSSDLQDRAELKMLAG